MSKKEFPVGSDIVLKRAEGGWVVYVETLPNKAKTGSHIPHASIEDGLAWVRENFDVG